MLKNIARALGGDPHRKEIERISQIVEQINALEKPMESLKTEELRYKTGEFRARLAQGESLDDILVEAFALVREASKRTIGLRHFNVQLIGGISMHEGKIAEMRTGEGKTLVATLPLYLNALTGRGAHLVTVNDYLARRDARWMAPIYHLLGLSVGVLQMSGRTNNARDAFIVDLENRSIKEEEDQLRMVPRAQAYGADITYGTNNEFGFDYLRDNLVMDINRRVQRGHHYAIIDEVDNILIDEARTPLIISGPASEDVAWYAKMAAVVKQLAQEDYDFDEKDRSIALTEIGEIHVEELLQIPLRDPDRPEDITPEQARLLGYLEQALKAELLYKKNKDYIVQNGQVVIVDSFTGRLMPGRRWSEGLHQAVEAKEGVKVNPENITHATITLQNYFRKYEKLSGMTGTALTEAEEFSTIYNLDVLEIPTNLDFEAGQPESDFETLQAKDAEGYTFTYYAEKEDPESKALYWKRKDYPDVVFRTEEAKLRAICMEIIRFHALGRPQLIGTTSIEHSERLSVRLQPEMIRRLMTVILIRQRHMALKGIEMVERALPEFEPLNQPLPELTQQSLRQHAQTLGIPSISLNSDENLEILCDFFDLDSHHREKLDDIAQGGIAHEVLNALKHDKESQIIEGAGAYGAVTIATNMAGRGVDIKLGGEIKETILSDVRQALNENGVDPYGMINTEMAEALQTINLPEESEQSESVRTFIDFLDDMHRVRAAGGLHVIGSERHEARRIDNQLRGRSGRQGDPGSSRFYLSLEDDLMRMFGGERAENMMRLFNLDPSIPLESRIIGRLVEQAQERVEGYNFDIRKHLLDYDDVLNDQRERIYSERDQVLVKDDLNDDVWSMLENEIGRRVDSAFLEADGLMKLFAFLDEVQPTTYYQKEDTRLASFNLRAVADYAKGKISDLEDAQSIQSGLVEIAKETVLAEKDHFLKQTGDFLSRSVTSFEAQLAERMELLDIFFDTVSDQENLSPSAVSEHLQTTLRLKIRISAKDSRALLEQNNEAQESLTGAIEEALKRIFLSRIVMTIEHRISGKLGLNLDDLLSEDWPAIESRIQAILDERYQERADFAEDANHPILQNLERAIREQPGNSGSDVDLVALLTSMAFGTQVAFNQQTHQRVLRRVNLLNYVFLSAQLFAGSDPESLKMEILSHLKDAAEKLQLVWGKMEMGRLIESQIEYPTLTEAYHREIESHLSADQSARLNETPLSALLSEGDTTIIQAFGARVRQVIYRHILLKSISDLWIEHLTRMEALRVSIRMEAYAKQDPLVQYKSFGSDTFKELLENIRVSVVSKMFRLQPSRPQTANESAQQTPQGSGGAQNTAKKKKKRKRHKKKS